MAKRQLLVGATAAAVVVGGGGYAIAASSGTTASYRLATAAVGNVERTLTLGGTVNSSARDNVSFAQSGTVKSVSVTQGEQVRAGQVLAALDPTSADAALLSAKAALAKAKAALASTTSSQAAAASTSSSSTQSSASKGSSSVWMALLKKAQDALRQAVQQADQAMQASKGASSAASLGCAGISAGSAPTPTATPTDSTTSGPSTPGPTPAQLQQCNDMLAALSQAQTAVSKAQQAEQMALSGLARVLAQASATSNSPSSAAPSSSSGSNSNRSNAASQGSNASSTNSASRLASDQAQVDQAEASLVAAQVARDNTVLRAPISGRVVAVGVTDGSSASTTATAVTLVGAGASSVVVSVPLAQISTIKVGQKARVAVSGSSSVVDAVVSNVGILATTASSGTTTYPVTVNLTGSSPALQGIGASVTIVTGSASHALTLPSSAITTTGTRSTVDVYSSGKVTTTAVTVGVLGSTTASITSGLKAGQQVVLADLNASVPTSTTSGNGLRGFGGGGLGGGLGVSRFRVGG